MKGRISRGRERITREEEYKEKSGVTPVIARHKKKEEEKKSETRHVTTNECCVRERPKTLEDRVSGDKFRDWNLASRHWTV